MWGRTGDHCVLVGTPTRHVPTTPVEAAERSAAGMPVVPLFNSGVPVGVVRAGDAAPGDMDAGKQKTRCAAGFALAVLQLEALYYQIYLPWVSVQPSGELEGIPEMYRHQDKGN